MATDIEVDRALATVRATLNDQRPESFDRDRVQRIVTGSTGGLDLLAVDEDGAIRDERGAQVGAVRRTPGGEWIAERL